MKSNYVADKPQPCRRDNHTAYSPLTIMFSMVLSMFAITTSQAQVLTVLHAFTGGSDGANPYAGLVSDSQNNLYGTTGYGGNFSCDSIGCGTVFKISSSGNFTTLYKFGGTSGDGTTPYGNLIIGSSSALFGTTFSGGTFGYGTVFELSSEGISILHAFDVTDGAQPSAGLTEDSSGNLYGTTQTGGKFGNGTIFEIASGVFRSIYNFAGYPTDGALPVSTLTIDESGNLYGTTLEGGAAFCSVPYGCGAVFELNSVGTETLLHSFSGYPADGETPYTGLTVATIDSTTAGYGTTYEGGTANCTNGNGAKGCGTVFKITMSGTESLLHSFSGSPDGDAPQGQLLFDPSSDVFYGSTQFGGANDYGTLFKIDGSGNVTILYSFSNGNDGGFPMGNLLMDSDGNLYGTANTGGAFGEGVVFRFAP